MTGRKTIFGAFTSAGIGLALQTTAALAADCNMLGAVALEAHDIPRREVLERLVTGKSINLEWIDQSVADEPIRGVFKGDFDRVLRMVLAGTNWMAAYDDGGEEECRVSKIRIIGSSSQAAQWYQGPT